MRRLWYAAFVFVVAVGVLDVLFLLGVTSPQQIRDAVLSPLRRTGSQFITDSSAPARFVLRAIRAVLGRLDPTLGGRVRRQPECDRDRDADRVVRRSEAVSSAGALGLMQVMPMHFTDGENMINPETNVRRGMGVFHECLSQFAGWDLGRALACYNGGPGVLSRSFENWPRETRSYYNWATGMWNEVVRGRDSSGTLDTWMSAGGSRLCQQALRRLSETSPLAYQVDGANTE